MKPEPHSATAISPAEWKIMRLLWQEAPLPAYDIIQRTSARQGWHPSTVKTLLARLQRKKALGTRRYKNLFLYYPLLSQDDCLQAESESFLDRFFGGSAKELLLHFARGEKITAKDLEELKRTLEKGGSRRQTLS